MADGGAREALPRRNYFIIGETQKWLRSKVERRTQGAKFPPLPFFCRRQA